MQHLHRTLTLLSLFFIALVLSACSAAPTPSQNESHLPSWADTATRQTIINFVTDVSDPSSPNFVPPEARIAVFDNDGTLWCERPLYFQFYFAFDRVRELAPQHPEWETTEPFASILNNEIDKALAQGSNAITQFIVATHTGMTTQEFHQIVTDWIATAQHPTTHRRYTEMVYQPQLELLDYLRAHDFEVFIVSGGGIEFMRPWTAETYGIQPPNVIGSHMKLTFQSENGPPQLHREPEMEVFNDKAIKPVSIQHHIGLKPILAFGNSDGDLQMLQYTHSDDTPSLCLYLHHTDSEREWAYDRESHVGKLDKGLDAAAANGWTVVDMKRDWLTVFPDTD